MLWSKHQLELLEVCVLIVLQQKILPKEDEREVGLVLNEIRTYLDELAEREQADAQEADLDSTA